MENYKNLKGTTQVLVGRIRKNYCTLHTRVYTTTELYE
jgi:hypothetical protein